MLRYIYVFLAFFVLCGCTGSSDDPAFTFDHDRSVSSTATAEREIFHQASLSVRTPMPAGAVGQYLLLDGQIRHLDSRGFDGVEFRLHIGFNAPASSTSSALLLHLVTAPHVTPAGMEFVCFAYLQHDTSRHNHEIDCGYFSTVAYYMSADRIGRASEHPFHDAAERISAWKAFVASPDNDLTGFYVSVFGTLQNALLGLSGDLFDAQRLSARPIMETIVSRFFQLYQREGRVTAQDLVDIANEVTDQTVPLDRLLRFQSIFDRFAHVADVTLEATGGSLTQRGSTVELLSMSNEVARFYLRGSPLAMSDFRTRVVRGLRHQLVDGRVRLNWEPIAHMYGYAVYIDGEQESFTRLPEVFLRDVGASVITVKAVGYGGEFDGVNYDLATPRAETSSARVDGSP